MSDSLDTEKSDWSEKIGIGEENIDPAPEKVQLPDHNTPWSVVGQEYQKFPSGVKRFIRWAVLVIAILAALNYGSVQLKSTICHWFPSFDYFCGASADLVNEVAGLVEISEGQ